MTEVRYFVRGDVDLATAPSLQRLLLALVKNSDGDLCIDCTQMMFIDSSGIRVLVQTRATLEAVGRHLRVDNLNGNCRRVFDILGLSELYRFDKRGCSVS